jgi:maltose alpha-D-glucosyltransferase/alpha-amylase
MRIHGDLHLGQVLVVQDDAYFIDFEGEPARALEERRAKSSPLRDVAGMIRSFDYAVALAGTAGAAVRNEAALAAQNELLQRFRGAAVDTFLTAYRQAAQDIPHHWKDQGGEDSLIRLFTLEKAAYEICYEAAQRPKFLHIPLRGLAAALPAGSP